MNRVNVPAPPSLEEKIEEAQLAPPKRWDLLLVTKSLAQVLQKSCIQI